MPELPEVETVKRGLEKIIPANTKIKSIELLRADLRFPMPQEIPQKFKNQEILRIERRAKYLLFHTSNNTLINHLGMTGTWREFQDAKDHDHIYLNLSNGLKLAYRDPRRFGILDFARKDQWQKHKFFSHLGPEPFDREQFTADYLFQQCKRRKVAIKTLIMNQVLVVGVGNIYASEALFRAAIRPRKSCHRLTKRDCERLVLAIREILQKAIDAGGSSISDFKSAGGDSGYFQHSFQVYDRKDKPCFVCETPIQAAVVGGRSSYWCRSCQS